MWKRARAAGTDYADLTGEPQFIRSSIDLYHKQAIDTGARIVHACGFDSIPSDLSVYALYRKAAEDGTGELGDTTFVVRSFRGGFSGGTLASMTELLRDASTDPDVRRLLNDPYSLSPDRGAEPDSGHNRICRCGGAATSRRSWPELWTAGFVMAASNTRVVRRSNALQDWAYGRRFRYSEAMNVGESFVAPVASAAMTGAIGGDIRSRQPLLPAPAA